MSHSLKLSSLQSLAAATAAQSGFSAPVTTPAGDTHAISDVNQLKFNEWTMIRDNAPKGPLFLAQTMVRIEKGLPEGTDLVEKVDFLFQSLHKALTPYFNWMFDAKEKHLITEGHLSTLQQRLAEQYENPALETIWEKCLSNLFQFPEGVERPVGHAAIRAFLNNPENAAQIQAVTVLDLGGNDLYTLPPEIGLFTGLTRLHAAQNQLYYLPEEIGNLKSLTELHLNNNKLAILPDSFYTLPALNKLYLMNNSFSSLPKSFANLTTLTDLSFSDNQFNSFPESICSLTNITYLSFDRNQLSSLPNSFGNLITIRNLNLANNRFTSLPEPIRELTQLGALDLYQNQLTSLPDWIGDFANLRFLNLSHSPLKILPDSIQRLTNLIKLRLNNIQLRSLPEWIGNLTALNSIELRGNRLSFLPESFVNLTALQWLYLTENWLVSIPNFSREIALTYKNNPFFVISDLELDISFDINLQILQERQREMLEYPSESSLASLFQLILRRADVSEIENTFDELDEQLKQHITALVRQESEQLSGPTCSSSEISASSSSSEHSDESLFADMALFAKSVRTSMYAKLESLPPELENKVYEEISCRLGGHSDLQLGRKNRFKHILRLIDAMEKVTASASASSAPEAAPPVQETAKAEPKKWPTVMTKPGFRSRG